MSRPLVSRQPYRSAHFGAAQAPGARPYQEDDYGGASFSGQGMLVAVLADGMGGEVGGSRASRVAVNAFLDAFTAAAGAPPQRLAGGLQGANRAIAAEIAEDAGLVGMGTTLLAAALSPDGLYWISVGDSPLYLYRPLDGPRALHRLNADHSYGALLDEQVAQGSLDATEAAAAEGRNQLISALDGGELDAIDAPPEPYPVTAADCVILASDGLLTLDEELLLQELERAEGRSPQELAERLVDAVLARREPQQDNVSVLVLNGAYAQSLPEPTPTQESSGLRADEKGERVAETRFPPPIPAPQTPRGARGRHPGLWSVLVAVLLDGALLYRLFPGDSGPPVETPAPEREPPATTAAKPKTSPPSPVPTPATVEADGQKRFSEKPQQPQEPEKEERPRQPAHPDLDPLDEAAWMRATQGGRYADYDAYLRFCSKRKCRHTAEAEVRMQMIRTWKTLPPWPDWRFPIAPVRQAPDPPPE